MVDTFDVLTFAIKTLIFEDDFHESWMKYILLERLLISLNNSEHYNTGMFDTNDASLLIDLYSVVTPDFINKLYFVYKTKCEEAAEIVYRENFNKMIRPKNVSKRKPSKTLLHAFVDILLNGYTVLENDKYRYIEPTEDFSDYNNSHCIYNYMTLCKATSILKNEPFKRWDVQEANDCIRRLSSSDLPIIQTIMNTPLEISRYNRPLLNQLDLYGNEFTDPYITDALAEIYSPLPWEEPKNTLDSYSFFEKNISDEDYIHKKIANLSDGLLLWLHAHGREGFLSQDAFFLHTLFLLSFTSEEKQKECISFTPNHSLILPEGQVSKYYKDLLHILSLPSIDWFFRFDNTETRKYAIESIQNNIVNKLPIWLRFTLCNLSDKQLLAAKSLYITLVLRKRYHKQKDNNSFPSELLELLQDEVSDIETLYNICKKTDANI